MAREAKTAKPDARDHLLEQALRDASTLAAAQTLEELAVRTGDALTRLLGCERCGVLRFAGDALTRLEDTSDQPLLREGEVAAAASALQARTPRLVSHVASSLGLGDEAATEPEAQTALALPIVLAGDELAVAVCSWPQPGHEPQPVRIQLARLLGTLAGSVAARLQTAARLAGVGASDDLTGAHTRESLDSLLAALREAAAAHAVVLIDVDAFAAYNERLGRRAGDRLLVALAGLVGRECREGDIVARAGADEFALVLPGSTAEAGRAAALRIVEAVADWGHEELVTVSAGVGAAIADSEVDALRLASHALAQAKEGGEGNVIAVA